MHALEKGLLYLFAFIPLSPAIVLSCLITLTLGSFAFVFSRNLQVVPSPIQNFLEWFCEEMTAFVENITGPKHARELLPFLVTIFVYVLFSNLLGLIPGFKSPTSIFASCLGLALIVFVMTHYLGFRNNGIGYLKHFVGEPLWMAPLMFPIHVIGEFARPVSLTLRLFGNILGEDIVIIVLTVFIFPFLVPIPMLLLAIFTSFLQALVFTILSGMYLAGAMASHDH